MAIIDKVLQRMAIHVASTNLSDYLTVGEAAATLGVSPATLRNWDKAGKLKAYRHPMNDYRLYKRSELEALLGKVEPIDDHQGRLL